MSKKTEQARVTEHQAQLIHDLLVSVGLDVANEFDIQTTLFTASRDKHGATATMVLNDKGYIMGKKRDE